LPPIRISFCSAASGFLPPTIDDIVAETRETYDGPLAVGEDLMAFEIGETVSVRRFPISG
jgi:ribonuclease Z